MAGRPPLLVWGVCIVFALLFTAGRPSVAAAPTLDLDALKVDAQSAAVDFLDDAAHPLSITTVASPAFAARFKHYVAPAQRYVSGWFRFAVRSKLARPGWLLEVSPAATDADLYVPDGHAGFDLTRFGMIVPLRARPYQRLPFPSLPVSTAMASGRPVYLHVVARVVDGRLDAPRLQTELSALAKRNDEVARSFTWIGIYAGLCIVDLLLFAYLREVAFLWYALIMTGWAFIGLIGTGGAWSYIWPWASLPVDVYFVDDAALTLLVALFARSFLELPKRAPILDKALLAFSFGSAIFLLFLMFEPWWIAGQLSVIPLIAQSIGFTFAGALLLRRGVPSARFYLIGFAGFFVGFMLSAYAPWVAALPWPFSYPWTLGVLWEGVFVTIAIADRVRIARAEAYSALAAREAALDQLATAQEQMLARVSAQNASMERFVPHPFLELLEKDSVEALALGDHTLREMTLLFSDIRSFTTLAESMSAEETFAFLNSYLAHTGPIIREHRGFIDKYIGDAIFALFDGSVSDAVDAAIDLQTGVMDYNQQRARAGYKPIAVGVGLHRGPLALGAIGERERVETTVIADAVNVAARMEGLTKLFGARIIVSEAVVAGVAEPERYRWRSLGRVQVQGATHGLEVFEVFDADPPDLIVSKVRSREAFAAAIETFGAGRFEDAQAAFERIVADAPGDRPAAYFAHRTQSLMSLPFATPWDGVERLETK